MYITLWIQAIFIHIMSTHTHTHTHIHTYSHTCTHIYTYTHIHVHAHTHIHTCVHTHSHTQTHTYVHTHTHNPHKNIHVLHFKYMYGLHRSLSTLPPHIFIHPPIPPHTLLSQLPTLPSLPTPTPSHLPLLSSLTK